MSALKHRIIDEAIQLFVKHGIRSVTMDELAKQCGISKRTLYENFEDKEQLLIQCVHKIQEAKMADHKAIVKASENVIEVLLTKVRQIMKDASQLKPSFHKEINKYYPSVAAIQEKYFREFVTNEISSFINKGIKQGFIRKSLNVEITTALLIGQIQHVINELSEKFPLSEIFPTMMLSFARGIATDKGIALIADFEKNNLENLK
ncbi:MAG: TetR/AcrR family transcriptional regulator [Flavobacteriales bacterium]